MTWAEEPRAAESGPDTGIERALAEPIFDMILENVDWPPGPPTFMPATPAPVPSSPTYVPFGYFFAACDSDYASDACVLCICCEPTDSKLYCCVLHTLPTPAYRASSAWSFFRFSVPGCCCLLGSTCGSP